MTAMRGVGFYVNRTFPTSTDLCHENRQAVKLYTHHILRCLRSGQQRRCIIPDTWARSGGGGVRGRTLLCGSRLQVA